METLEIRIANMNLQVSVDTQNCLDVMEFSNLLEIFFSFFSFFFRLIRNLKKIHENFPYVEKTVSSKLD